MRGLAPESPGMTEVRRTAVCQCRITSQTTSGGEPDQSKSDLLAIFVRTGAVKVATFRAFSALF
jgi:hypothetical protein